MNSAARARAYENATIQVRDGHSRKVKSIADQSYTNTDLGRFFIYLTQIVPNWETYLTPKQRESAKLYVKELDCNKVDEQLKLRLGTTYERIFGSKPSKNDKYGSKGAIGRLKEAAVELKKTGAIK